MITDRNESTDMTVRRASFDAAWQMIADALEMPLNCEIVGARWDYEHSTIRFYVESPDLDPVYPGGAIPNIPPTIRKTYYTWDWRTPRAGACRTLDGRPWPTCRERRW